jgi:LysM repeat protein
MTRRLRLLVGGIFALLLIVGAVVATNRPATAAQTSPASEILRLVNEYRATYGLPPFRYNAALASAAQSHANWMAATVLFSHTGEGGSTPLTRAQGAGFQGAVSENIVGGSQMSPRQGLIWWQNSPTHHNTLVSSRYDEAGTGYATNGSQNMYVLVVGRHDSSALNGNLAKDDTSTEVLIIVPIELAKPKDDGSIVHEIKQGQALWTVAAYYDIDLSFLYQINGMNEDSVVHPGDEVFVRLADGQPPPPTPTPPLTHVVQEGESAWTIAGQHDIGLDFLYLLNDMQESSVLQPGDEVVIRLAEGQAPPPTPTPRVHHEVRAGESAWVIAALHELTVEELMALNDLNVETILRPGDLLLIRQPASPTNVGPPTEISATPTPATTADPAGAQTAIAMQAATMPNEGWATPVSPRISNDLSAPAPRSAVTLTADANEASSSAGQSIGAGVVALVVASLLIIIILIAVAVTRQQR